MNKTTIKISVLAFLGFMTYGYAQQQQQDPYKGKVGVNTVTPSATMDVQPNNDNARVEAKTNEGIIAPKLSKTRIANIETPVEGTLVYATDDATSLISAYTGNDPKVAKITEKGYYFYNGTEWVKAGNNSLAVDGSKWTNDTANNVVKLTNLSDGTTPRTDEKNIFINDNGYIGIGTNSPSERILVKNGGIKVISDQENSVPVVYSESTKATFPYAAFALRASAITSPFQWNIALQGSRGGNFEIATAGGTSNGIKFVINRENGNVGISTVTPTEKLDVAGKIKSSALSGTGDRVVVADQNGVLKTSQFVMKATDTSSSCSQENAGAIHYKEIDKGGKMVGVFGFCTRDTQGNYKWAYNMGGANMLDGTGAFGSGL